MDIPYESLVPNTLRALIEEFVTREGTDYGEQSFTLDEKVKQVMTLLHRGTAVVVFDEKTETCDIVVRI